MGKNLLGTFEVYVSHVNKSHPLFGNPFSCCGREDIHLQCMQTHRRSLGWMLSVWIWRGWQRGVTDRWRADLPDLPNTDFVLQGFCFAGSGQIPFSSAADIKPIHFRQCLKRAVACSSQVLIIIVFIRVFRFWMWETQSAMHKFACSLAPFAIMINSNGQSCHHCEFYNSSLYTVSVFTIHSELEF